MEPSPHIFNLNRSQLRQLLGSWGLPAFRADQVLEWVYRRLVVDPMAMTNLSRPERQMLADRLRFATGRVIRHQVASDQVQKLLIDWPAQPDDTPPDQSTMHGPTECVAIPSRRSCPTGVGALENRPTVGRHRRTACVSSQIGCPVGCTFCASGLGGLDGNLTSGQIIEQVWRLSVLEGIGRITHVVFMGMGEPLANFEAVTGAIRTLTAPWGPAISGRRITVSTVGLPAQIRRLADLKVPVTLAISLHAPNDDLRRRLIPWARHVSIRELIDAGRIYFERTGREVTLEYTLLGGINDQPEHAKQLSQVAKQLRSNINLIRYNEVNALPFQRPDTDRVLKFQSLLRQSAVNAHIRASRGRDIAAACGQLSHEHAVGSVALNGGFRKMDPPINQGRRIQS